MSDWQDISELPKDGKLRLFLARGGAYYIAPSVEDMSPEKMRAACLEVYEATGEWPNAKNLPAYFMDLPSPPSQEGRT